MQCGVHLLAGLLICRILPRRSLYGARAGVLRYGVVLGAILPDIDLPLAALMVAVTGDDGVADVYHRTFSHCILFVLLCLLCFLAQRSQVERAVVKKSWLAFLQSSEPGRHNAGAVFDSATFGIGMTIGLVSHIVLDMLYMKGVAVLWPFSSHFYGYPPFGHWTDMSPLTVKLLECTDHFTDIALFLAPLLTNAEKYRIDAKLYQRAIRYCCVKAAIVTGLTALAFYEGLSFEAYFVLLYLPGTVFFVISVFLPIIFRDALHYVGDPLEP